MSYIWSLEVSSTPAESVDSFLQAMIPLSSLVPVIVGEAIKCSRQ